MVRQWRVKYHVNIPTSPLVLPNVQKSLQNTFLFDKVNHQLYFSDKEHCFRMLSNDAKKYVELTLITEPELNVSTNGTITVKDLPVGVDTQDVSVKVLKLEDGKCWLWCTNDDVTFGAIVMRIE